MGLEIWVFVVPIAVFVIHQFIHRAAVEKNEKGQCAKCSCKLSEDDFVGLTASHHLYGYCKRCGAGVKLRDRMLLSLLILAFILTIGAYFVFSNS
jgi:hypothetical protein